MCWSCCDFLFLSVRFVPNHPHEVVRFIKKSRVVRLFLSWLIDFSTLESDYSATRSGVGTVYLKRLRPNFYLIYGNITPVYNDNSITLPMSSPLAFSQVFTLYGAGMNSTKGFIANNANSIGFTYQSTGNTYKLLAHWIYCHSEKVARRFSSPLYHYRPSCRYV